MAADGGRPLALTPPPSTILLRRASGYAICQGHRAVSRRIRATRCCSASRRASASVMGPQHIVPWCMMSNAGKRTRYAYLPACPRASAPSGVCAQRAAAQQSGMLHAGALHRVASPAIAAVKAWLPRQGSGLLRLSMLAAAFLDVQRTRKSSKAMQRSSQYDRQCTAYGMLRQRRRHAHPELAEHCGSCHAIAAVGGRRTSVRLRRDSAPWRSLGCVPVH